jgi:hypothetical protein
MCGRFCAPDRFGIGRGSCSEPSGTQRRVQLGRVVGAPGSGLAQRRELQTSPTGITRSVSFVAKLNLPFQPPAPQARDERRAPAGRRGSSDRN